MDVNPSIEMLIVQTTPFCNIDCTYCYLPNRNIKTKIDPDIISRTVSLLTNAKWVGDSLSIVWHAGEPLAVGVEHLRKLIEACAPFHDVTHLQHYVQTNATLLTPQFCRFFKEKEIRIGISLDGPKDLHDRKRLSRLKSGTFDKVMDGVQLLRGHQIGFSVICVVGSDSLDRAEELYTFFEGIGAASVGFNIEEIEGTNTSTSMSQDDFFTRLARFWEDLFQIHYKRKSFVLREADTIVSALRYPGRAKVHNQQANPFSIMTVSVGGEIGSFSPELLGQQHEKFGDFSIGNVRTATPESILNNGRLNVMQSEIAAGVNRCAATCEYFDLCGGGAPSNKLFENGSFDSTETKYCRAVKKTVIDAMLVEARRQRIIEQSQRRLNELVTAN